MRLSPFLAALATVALAAPMRAQQPAPPRASVLSFQPLSAVFGIAAFEYEHATGPATTVGVGGTFSHQNGTDWFGGSSNHATYSSADVKLRYYPARHALGGFSVGALAGYVHATQTSLSNFGGATQTQHYREDGPSIGAEASYAWLLGRSRATYLALGGGVKHVFIGNSDLPNPVPTYPTVRFSLGYAF